MYLKSGFNSCKDCFSQSVNLVRESNCIVEVLDQQLVDDVFDLLIQQDSESDKEGDEETPLPVREQLKAIAL